jgi:hypothetical protein
MKKVVIWNQGTRTGNIYTEFAEYAEITEKRKFNTVICANSRNAAIHCSGGAE